MRSSALAVVCSAVSIAARAADTPPRRVPGRIASMSKPITAAPVITLMDEGKVEMEDPVFQCFPEFKSIWAAVEEDEKHLLLRRLPHPITIRNLLSHTSGLVRRSAVEQPSWGMLTIAQAVRSYSITPLRFEPGTKYGYTNSGINTGARIVEVVSGMPFEQFLEKRIFQPVEMKDTTLVPTRVQVRRLANPTSTTIRRTIWPKPRSKCSVIRSPVAGRQPMPGGGLFSTTLDYTKFGRMILGGRFPQRQADPF
jgi:CubicO group peptidase (beta-lactamase class C family)